MIDDNKIISTPLSSDKVYQSPLYKKVPRTKIPISSPEFDKMKCWHCQQFPRLVADPDVLIWCERCYILQHQRDDGTYVDHKPIPVLKKLAQDIDEHRYVEATLKKADTRIIEE